MLDVIFIRINKKRARMMEDDITANYTEDELNKMGNHSPRLVYTLSRPAASCCDRVQSTLDQLDGAPQNGRGVEFYAMPMDPCLLLLHIRSKGGGLNYSCRGWCSEHDHSDSLS